MERRELSVDFFFFYFNNQLATHKFTSCHLNVLQQLEIAGGTVLKYYFEVIVLSNQWQVNNFKLKHSRRMMTIKTASVTIIAICKYYSHGTLLKRREWLCVLTITSRFYSSIAQAKNQYNIANGWESAITFPAIT